MKKAAIFLAKGFEEIEAITIIDVLNRAGISVKSVSISDKLEVHGAHNITIIADLLISDVNDLDYDILLLPGGMPGTTNLLECKELIHLIKKFNSEEKWLASICAAPMVFGQCGILENKKATCYPGFEKYLDGAITSRDQVVIDGNIITSRGPGTAFKFSQKIVEKLLDKNTANDLQSKMLYE